MADRAGQEEAERSQPAVPLVINVPLRFQDPPGEKERATIVRVATLMLVHTFEVHDIRPEGESITRIAVSDHIKSIRAHFDPNDPSVAIVEFTVGSRQDKEALVWTSSLMFQYIHYKVVEIATINGKPHTIDWEASQDPGAPERVIGWVESGRSMIERMKRVQQS